MLPNTNSKLQLEKILPLAEAETGMDFSGSRITRLEDAVAKLVPRFSDRCNFDRILAVPQERSLFLDRLAAELTVGESFFFRNEHHFRALREHVLPEILRENSEKRELRIWSAGCAAGEEAYSLAILLDQVLGNRVDWRVSILGTDLNAEFLQRASAACYRPWSFRQTTIHEDRTYFSRERDTYRVAPRIRDMVRFAYLNLVKDVYPSPLTGTLGLDLILFRNVAIYLKSEITKCIMNRFHHALRPGGWLLLGESEVSSAPIEGFEPRRFENATFHLNIQDATTSKSTAPPSKAACAPIVAPTTAPQGGGAMSVSQPPAVLSRPTLPEWVVLPTSRKRVQSVRESAEEEVARLSAEGKFDESERAIERIADKKHRAKLRLQLAQRLLAFADAARARSVLARCLTEEPLMVEAQLLQASFYEEAGDLDAAAQAYRRALYIDRVCPMAHFHLALVLQRKGDHAGAKRSVQTTLKLINARDDHDLVEYGEGVCYGRLRELAFKAFPIVEA